MTCREVYRITLLLMAEDGERGDTGDLEKRFLPLLNAFCLEAGGRDTVCAEGLDEPFPLEKSYAYPCAFFAGAMLLADENSEQAELLSSQSDRLMNAIRRSETDVSPISDRYC